MALHAKALQGEASSFPDQALDCQRSVLCDSGWRSVGPARCSRLLDGLVGSGARPGLTRGGYLVVILGFADASSAATQR